MSEEKLENSNELKILERLSAIEEKLERKERKRSIIKPLILALQRAFCRQNLELFLSLVSLAISLSIAFYLFTS